MKRETPTMAKIVEERIRCDIDGTAGAEPTRFGFEGSEYEIDLSPKRKRELINSMAPFMERARRLPPRKAGPKRGHRNAQPPAASTPDASGRGPARPDPAQSRAIREWAARKGYTVAPRGVVSQEIRDRYDREAGR